MTKGFKHTFIDIVIHACQLIIFGSVLLGSIACSSIYQKKAFLISQLSLLDQYKKWDLTAKVSMPISCMTTYDAQKKYLTDIIKLQADYIIGNSGVPAPETTPKTQTLPAKE